jgi:hypothetical protein
MAGAVAAAHAAGDTATQPAPTARKSTVVKKSSPARKPAAKKADAAEATPEKTAGLPRRLDEINIEGEIAVPQVLFVTARDQRRFMDFQQRRYVKSSLEVGTEKVFPTWIAVIHPPTADPRKETHP